MAENRHERTADGTVDLALHLERPSKGRLMCRKVGAIHTGIFAKKSTHPTKWIGLDHSMDNWPEMELAKQILNSELELRINTLDGIKSAVEQTGWALMRCIQSIRDGKSLKAMTLMPLKAKIKLKAV